MTHPLEDLYIRPLFYDALSGEFNPSSDPNRSHTLARLMVATFTRGAKEFDLESGVCAYSPSWSPDITARTDYDFEGMAMLASGLSLWRGDVNEMCVYDETDVLSSNLFLRSPGHEDRRFDLNLGGELETARAAVTQAAQEYFS